MQIGNYSWRNGTLQSGLLFKCTGCGQCGLGRMVLRCRCPGPDNSGGKFPRAYSKGVCGTCGSTGEEVVHIFDPGLVITPQRRILSCHTPQRCLEVLIGLLRLSVRLRMKTQKKAYCGTQGITKSFQNLVDELWSPIRYNVLKDSMNVENMREHEIHCFLGETKEVHRFKEIIYNGEYDRVASRRGKCSNEIKCNVRPGTSKSWQLYDQNPLVPNVIIPLTRRKSHREESPGVELWSLEEC